MSCPSPLNIEENKDDTALNPVPSTKSGNEFDTKNTLSALHYLISNCADILEDSEDLLEQCYFDRKGLLEILTAGSQKTLIQFISSTVPNWYCDVKDELNFKRMMSFTKQFAKDGKIVASLHFLLMLKKEYTSLFINGVTSFQELQSCYEKTTKFQTELTAKYVFLNIEIDKLIGWLEENQEAVQVSENIVMADLADFENSLECHNRSIQTFFENLNFFCNDLKQHLIKNMLAHIDDSGRALQLCPPYNANSKNRGKLILETYSRNLSLKEKINYLVFNGFVE